jgi:XTP/dITP diphosphohydrolase
MKIQRLVIGTGNAAKLSEWSSFLSPHISILSLKDFPPLADISETGTTFAENARIKAATYAKSLGEFVFSEDGGYEIDFLGGLPGIKSRRILPGDKEGTDDELIDYVLQKLKGVPDVDRGVKLTSAAALSDPEGQILFEDSNSSVGLVTKERGPVLIPGYPFRTIHFLPDLGKTYAELTPEEHEKFSHKRPIAQKLIEFLSDFEY